MTLQNTLTARVKNKTKQKTQEFQRIRNTSVGSGGTLGYL